MTTAMHRLAAQLTPSPDALAARVRWGVVQAIVAGPPATITLQLAGATAATPGVRYIASYTPTIGDTVVLLASGSDLLALGVLA